jgi:M6 family metalloprotease-like protein
MAMKRIASDCSDSAVHVQFLYKFLFCFVALFLSISQSTLANEPPRPGEIEYLKQTGQYEERLAAARAIGNDQVDPDLLNRAIYRTQRDALIQQGVNPEGILSTPPSSWSLLPTRGNVKVFALLIDFIDYPGYDTKDQINSALFADGSLLPNNTFPYESLKNYYQRSSYGQLDFSSGVTLGWYHAPYNRSTVTMTSTGRQNLIKEALNSLGGSVDFAQFDNDGNGQIEYFIVIWTGPNNGWSNFWWGYQTSFSDSTYTINGKRLGKYSWQWERYNEIGSYTPSVVIHETGHGLGLPDLYDYDTSAGPMGGVGDLDMMDGNWGDHNCFSKWLLDWLSPTIIGSGSQNLTLNPSGTSKDAVMITAGASGNPFSEFFMVQNRYRAGNDSSTNYPADGMLIWHVDATLDSTGADYQYDNSYTAHKLLKLVQADGLDRIEQSSASRADAAMYYQPGKTFGSTTVPSSKNYQGVFTRAHVANIAQSGTQMTATFSIEDPSVGYILTVTKAGVGGGTVTDSKSGIACGTDCSESYVSGDVVTLTAVASPGSVFTGWSGGCSGTGTCVVTLSANAAVTATFSSTILIDEDFDPEVASGPVGWSVVNSGRGSWWFTYQQYNTSGGTGESALGAVAAGSTSPYDTELRASLLNLSSYNSVGIEFKTSLEASGATADVDVSVNGSAGPWVNVWRKTGFFLGPQTVTADLTAAAAGRDNVMIRFHLYGTSIWWIIDDVKLMANSATGSPNVTLSGSSLNFGRQIISTTSITQNVTLTNSGTANLNITAFSFAGTNPGDFSQTNDCAGPVAAGGFCTVHISFKPTAAGVRTGSLLVTNNAAGSPYTVTLIGNGSSVTTAGAYHIFPQIADGYFGDGTYFQSTVTVTNSNPGTTTPNCVLQFHGLTIGGQSTLSFGFSGAYVYTSPGTQALQTGYASLQCSSNVEAQLLYTEYSHTGTKISEATVFSSPLASSFRFIADERGGTQLGLAIANDSAATRKYTINIYSSSGSLIGSPEISLDPWKSRAVYLDQLATIPSNYLGIVDIIGSSGATASLIGLRFTGDLFTTVPASVMDSSTASATTSTRHVFPQMADGYFGDGTYYQSTVIVTNSSSGTMPSCALQLHGFTIGGQSTLSFTLSGAYLLATPGNSQALKTGYATLLCSSNVEAQLLYTEYSRTGTKISEATVFSSPSANSLRIIGDERGGTQLGLAVANDSDQTGRYTISIYGSNGALVGTYQMTVDAGKNRAVYLDELAAIPANYLGIVDIVSTSGTASLIGLRFTGSLFTTVPGAIMK